MRLNAAYLFYIPNSTHWKPHNVWQILVMKFQLMILNVPNKSLVSFRAISIPNGSKLKSMVTSDLAYPLLPFVMNWYKNRLRLKSELYSPKAMSRVPYRPLPFVSHVDWHIVSYSRSQNLWWMWLKRVALSFQMIWRLLIQIPFETNMSHQWSNYAKAN